MGGTSTRLPEDIAKQTEGPSEPPFVRVFLREHGRLRRIAAGMGMTHADVDDVLQDVSVQVLRHSEQLGQENDMIRWLVKTTVNQCLMEHRRRFRRTASQIVKRKPDVLRIDENCPDAGDEAGSIEELDVVRSVLAELDPSLLLVVVLRYFCDMNATDIGGILELNASTVRSRLREARMILAGRLFQRGIEPS